MTFKSDAREMTDAEFEAAKAAMWRDAAERRAGMLQKSAAALYYEQRLPDQAAYLEQHGRTQDRLRSEPMSKAPDDASHGPDLDDEERLAAITQRNAEIDASVTEQVKRYFPHLVDGG